MVSIICPVYNEEKYIKNCIDSILLQDYSFNNLELILIDGNSNDNTVNIIKEYSKKYNWIKLINNPNRIVPVAMNLGIKNAKGTIIIRLDAHASYAENYITVLVKKLDELNADNVGCIWKTDVFNKNQKTLAIIEILSNRLGVGNSIFRLGIDEIKEVDTVPFGCWRREVFEKYGYFDTRLVRNQDIELNKRIKRGGGKIYLVPDTYCIYFARETYFEIAKNNFQNGKWNIMTIFFTKNLSSLSIRHFVPMIFVLSLLFPFFFLFISSKILLFSLFSLISYFLLILFTSIILSIKKKLNILYLLSGFIVLHFSYGFGSFTGLIKVLLLTLQSLKKMVNHDASF